MAASSAGHLDLLRWLLEQKCPHNITALVIEAAGNGHIHLLRFFAAEFEVRWEAQMTFAPARNGHLAVLQWLRQPEEGELRLPCPWNSWTVTSAAVFNQKALIEWATANGARMRPHAMAAAAQEGHLGLVQWMRERNLPMDTHVIAAAASKGQLAIVQYLRSGQFPCPWDAGTTYRAAKYGYLRVLAWAMQNGCPTNNFAWSTAAGQGHILVLRYLYASGYPLILPTRAALRTEGMTGHEGLHLSIEWMDRMRSRWQRVRNRFRVRAILRWWSRSEICNL